VIACGTNVLVCNRLRCTLTGCSVNAKDLAGAPNSYLGADF
jgi:hypothetical protein